MNLLRTVLLGTAIAIGLVSVTLAAKLPNMGNESRTGWMLGAVTVLTLVTLVGSIQVRGKRLQNKYTITILGVLAVVSSLTIILRFAVKPAAGLLFLFGMACILTVAITDWRAEH